MKESLSSEAALAEVKSYTGLDLTADEISSLYEILTVQRNDAAIITHLRKANHRLGDLEYVRGADNWWDKVRKDMEAAEDDPYINAKPGTHKNPVPHDRDAVNFWLERRILPALTGEDIEAAGPRNSPFVPAHASHFCIHCGFPFRAGALHRPYCQEYYKYADHGQCERRLEEAQDPDGLRMRLKITQEANPNSRLTNKHAISYHWVSLHYPDVNLEEWEPGKTSGNAPREQLAWKREEVILAMELYFRLKANTGRSIPDQSSSEIVELSNFLRKLSAYPVERQSETYRNPNDVHLKLTNLRAVQTSAKHGMGRYSQRDAAVWREFEDDIGRLQTEAAAIRARRDDGTIKPATTKPTAEDVDIEQQHTESFIVSPSGEPRTAERAEQKLVLRYRDYMKAKGIAVHRKKYLPAQEIRPIYSDVWVEDRNALIEAKNSDSRDAIRFAIGQLYDYRRFHQAPINLAVLLPYEPSAERLDLLRSAGIEALWPHGSGFRDSAGGIFV